MLKTITFVTLALFMNHQTFGQLLDGSYVPNFTVTDIEGNNWELYDLLDDGKSVVLDFSTTWCSPCWDYHQSHVLDSLYNLYGPNSTDEMMVFFIESDEGTNVNCLYGNAGCNFVTMGDYVTGTEYPIINDHTIGSLYEVWSYPTICLICPNREVFLLKKPSVSELYHTHLNCEAPKGINNLSIQSLVNSIEYECTLGEFTPSIRMQNVGSGVISSATIILKNDGLLQETINWTGNLSAFQDEVVNFKQLTPSDKYDFEIEIVDVNGIVDDFPVDNSISKSINSAHAVTENIFTLKVHPKSEKASMETYLEVLSSDGHVLYSRGNALAVGGEFDKAALFPANKKTTVELVFPQDDCFEVKLYDYFKDGFDDIGYTLRDTFNQLVFEGPSQGATNTMDSQRMRLDGGKRIWDNAKIIEHSGEGGIVCEGYNYKPILTIQNIGIRDLESMVIKVLDDDGLLFRTRWSGVIAPWESDTVHLDDIIITDENTIDYIILKAYYSEDEYIDGNILSTQFNVIQTNTASVNLEIQLDGQGQENAWMLKNSNGTILAEGIGQPNQLIQENIPVLANADDCYSLILTDLAEDGFLNLGVSSDTAYIRLSDNNGLELFSQGLLNEVFSEKIFDFRANTTTSIVGHNQLSSLKIHPNPVDDILHLSFYTKTPTRLDISFYDLLGQKIKTVAKTGYSIGQHTLDVPTTALTSGLYLIRVNSEDGSQDFVKKVMIQH